MGSRRGSERGGNTEFVGKNSQRDSASLFHWLGPMARHKRTWLLTEGGIGFIFHTRRPHNLFIRQISQNKTYKSINTSKFVRYFV
jgi:hypothetical protein